MAYNYRDSGLDNVFLENGYVVHQTPYGEGVSIQNTAELHQVIGRWLIDLHRPLDGAGLRFIRMELELTQRDLAAVLGTTEQTLRLWEKHRGKPINGSADRLLRALYAEFIGGDGSVREMVDRLAHFEQVADPEARLRETDGGWVIQQVQAA